MDGGAGPAFIDAAAAAVVQAANAGGMVHHHGHSDDHSGSLDGDEDDDDHSHDGDDDGGMGFDMVDDGDLLGGMPLMPQAMDGAPQEVRVQLRAVHGLFQAAGQEAGRGDGGQASCWSACSDRARVYCWLVTIERVGQAGEPAPAIALSGKV